MKRIWVMPLLLTWFMFKTFNEGDVVKFLNVLPKGTETKMLIAPTSSLNEFYIFYNAPQKINLK
jgi:hypothetical protein